jgi:uncharacterized protein YecA (UPF0149 family)
LKANHYHKAALKLRKYLKKEKRLEALGGMIAETIQPQRAYLSIWSPALFGNPGTHK